MKFYTAVAILEHDIGGDCTLANLEVSSLKKGDKINLNVLVALSQCMIAGLQEVKMFRDGPMYTVKSIETDELLIHS